MFQKAERRGKKGRIALAGPTGSGKTMSAMRIARGLAGSDGRIAVIDTEHGSASLYAGMDVPAGETIEFDTLELESFHPQKYIEGITAAVKAGYDVLVIDSLSHAWAGKDGVLAFVDRQKSGGSTKNGFAAWNKGTELQNRLIETILAADIHVIVTMRTKMEYVQEPDERGKISIRKVGLQPVQRDNVEYEFDAVFDLDTDHTITHGKHRTGAVLEGKSWVPATEEIGQLLHDWLDGAPAATAAPPKAPPAQRNRSNEPPPPPASQERAKTQSRRRAAAPKPEPSEELPGWIENYTDILDEMPDRKRDAILRDTLKHGWSQDQFEAILEKQGLLAPAAASTQAADVPDDDGF